MVEVSVIIVSWNTKEILRECLESVYRETNDIELEVILIDNASTDGSAEMVQQEFPQVVLICNSKNRGFAAANNQGIEVAKGRFVLLLNPDTVVLDRAIQKTIAFADEHPRAGAVGIRNTHANGDLQKNCFRYASVLNLLISTFGLHRLFSRSKFFGRERMLWWDYADSRKVDVVAGCYMLVRKEVIDQIGGLDETYFMYGEEMDWCWRMQNAGWEVWFYCGATIIHYGGMSSAQNPAEMQCEAQRSLLYFIQKRQGKLGRAVCRGLLMLSGAFRLVYWGFRWIGARGDVRELSAKKFRQAMIATAGR